MLSLLIYNRQVSEPKNRWTSSRRLSSQSLAETQEENKQLLQNLDFFFQKVVALALKVVCYTARALVFLSLHYINVWVLGAALLLRLQDGTTKFFRIWYLILSWCQFKGEPIVWSSLQICTFPLTAVEVPDSAWWSLFRGQTWLPALPERLSPTF